MSTSDLSVEHSFELEIEDEDQVGRGLIITSDEPPISRDRMTDHADDYGNYDFHDFGENFSVVHLDGFAGDYGEFETWRMAYGVNKIGEDSYLVWLRYRPRENKGNHHGIKPWQNIIQNLGGE